MNYENFNINKVYVDEIKELKEKGISAEDIILLMERKLECEAVLKVLKEIKNG